MCVIIKLVAAVDDDDDLDNDDVIRDGVKE